MKKKFGSIISPFEDIPCLESFGSHKTETRSQRRRNAKERLKAEIKMKFSK